MIFVKAILIWDIYFLICHDNVWMLWDKAALTMHCDKYASLVLVIE